MKSAPITLFADSPTGGDVPWSKIGDSPEKRGQFSSLVLDVKRRIAVMREHESGEASSSEIWFRMPGWITLAEVRGVMSREDVRGALDALSSDVPAQDAERVFAAIGVLEKRVSAMKGLPQIGDELAISKRASPILPSGYGGRVRVVGVSPYWAMLRVQKLDQRGLREEEFALVSSSDTLAVKTPAIDVRRALEAERGEWNLFDAMDWLDSRERHG